MYTDALPVFPTLYKSKAKGKITQWEVSVVPTGTDAPTSFHIVTVFGDTDGAKQTHTTLVAKGKAKRTPLQQATLEARSKWNEKKTREAYGETVPNASADSTTTPMRPMLANTFDKALYAPSRSASRGYKIPFPMYAQRKYDGIRCMCHINMTNTIVRGLNASNLETSEDVVRRSLVLESRKGVIFHNLESLQQDIQRVLSAGVAAGVWSPTVVLDGELYTNTIPFETLSGLVRLGPTATNTSAMDLLSFVEYHLYDFYDPVHPTWSFHERNCRLERVFASAPSTIKCLRVPTVTVDTLDRIDELHRQYVDEGFEGIMLRASEGAYEPNKRSKFLQKYKEFMEEEFVIVGFHDGDGIDQGLVIWECVTKNGTRFSAKPRGTHEHRRQLFEHAQEHVGKLLTVVFQEYSTDGTPRFPIGKAIRDGT